MTYLLLVAAGTIWICGIVGACIWWAVRRADRHRIAMSESGDAEDGDAAGAAPADCDTADVSQSCLPMEALRQARCSPESMEDGMPDDSPSRTSPLRFPYRQRQWVAPCVRGRLPTADDFFMVECRELFGDGISFYSEAAWETETLVITLGTHGTMVFMLARVMSQVPQSAEEPSGYQLECQFIRRIREDTGRWARALRSVYAC